MKKLVLVSIATLFLFSLSLSYAGTRSKYYATGLCNKPGYTCVKVKRGQSWKKLFPVKVQLDIVQRVNRTNMGLWRNKTIAVPDNLDKITLHDVSPFPAQIKATNNKLIIVDQDKLAWGAYDANGKLVKWGPISSGKNYCSDIGRPCITRAGMFYMFNKKDKRCKSGIFPVGRGGSSMPYCMFFYRGYALHGSNEVPGYRASHGCVRLFTRDAKWLNQDFIELSNPYQGIKGTQVIVQELTSLKEGTR